MLKIKIWIPNMDKFIKVKNKIKWYWYIKSEKILKDDLKILFLSSKEYNIDMFEDLFYFYLIELIDSNKKHLINIKKDKSIKWIKKIFSFIDQKINFNINIQDYIKSLLLKYAFYITVVNILDIKFNYSVLSWRRWMLKKKEILEKINEDKELYLQKTKETLSKINNYYDYKDIFYIQQQLNFLFMQNNYKEWIEFMNFLSDKYEKLNKDSVFIFYRIIFLYILFLSSSNKYKGITKIIHDNIKLFYKSMKINKDKSLFLQESDNIKESINEMLKNIKRIENNIVF